MPSASPQTVKIKIAIRIKNRKSRREGKKVFKKIGEDKISVIE